MKSTLVLLHVVLVTAGAASAVAADEKGTGFPDAELKAYLAKQGLPVLQQKPGGTMQRDFDARWLKWCRRVIIEPAAAQLKNDDETRRRFVRVVEQGLLRQRDSEQVDVNLTTGDIAAECDALEKAGVDSPLLLWVRCWCQHDSTRDFPASEALWARTTKHAAFKKMPAVLRLTMYEGFASLINIARQSDRRKPRGADVMQAAIESLQEKTWERDEDDLLYERLTAVIREELLKTDEPKVKTICEQATLTEWGRLMLQAKFNERKAWLARGHSFADGVTDEGWKGFGEYRAAAVNLFAQAWELHPDRPEAATYLLGITMTGGETGAPASVWLQRALDARFDNLSGFRFIMNGLLPRWGGSHRQMIDFGLVCAMTKRFDTRVPYFFFEALRDVVRDADEWQSFCRDPLIAKVAVALCRQRVHDAPTSETKRDALALLGSYGWLCGDYKTAVDALSQCPEPFSRPVALQLMAFDGWNEQIIRGESVIFAAGLEGKWLDAKRAWEEHDLDKAVAMHGEVLASKQVTGAGRELAASRMASAQTEQELAKGGWVPLRIDPSLAGWQIQKGDWSGTADGHLVNRGKGTSAFIYHTARIGADFEMRGEFQAGKSGVGVVLDFTGNDAPDEKWTTCIFEGGKAGLLDRHYSGSVQKRRALESPDFSSFLITCFNGSVTVEINGQRVFTEITPMKFYNPHEKLMDVEDGHVGFCNKLFQADNVTTILKCEVRRLPPDYSAKADVTLEDPGRIKGAPDLLAYLEGTLWESEKDKDGVVSEVLSGAAKREFWFRGKGDDTRHLLFRPVDAKTLDLDKGAHVVRFSGDYRSFAVSDWPRKGQSAVWTFRSRTDPTAERVPFDFTGTTWQRADSKIEFKGDGIWRFPEGKKLFKGTWNKIGARTAAAYRDDLLIENFEVSADGQWLTRGDGKNWRKAPAD